MLARDELDVALKEHNTIWQSVDDICMLHSHYKQRAFLASHLSK